MTMSNLMACDNFAHPKKQTGELMNITTQTQSMTMSSREIAELTSSRHDNVKRSMERMASNQIIKITPMEEPNSYRGKPLKTYHVNKRDSYVVVAQLCPEFTARLVDRWQELEEANQFKVPQSLPEALLLAAELARQNEEAHKQLAIAAPKAEFADAIAGDSKGVLLGQFAKTVGMGPVTIFRVLRELGVLISTPGKQYNIPYQPLIDRGYFTVKQGTYGTASEKRITHTAMITGKGEMWLRKKLIETGHLKAVAS